MTQIKFHLDESVSIAVATGLRRRGINITTPQETGLRSAADEVHLAFARAQQRVIITHDRDFLRLVQQGAQHPGIAYCDHERRTVGEIVRALLAIWENTAPSAIANTIVF